MPAVPSVRASCRRLASSDCPGSLPLGLGMRSPTTLAGPLVHGDRLRLFPLAFLGTSCSQVGASGQFLPPDCNREKGKEEGKGQKERWDWPFWCCMHTFDTSV